MKYVLFIIFLFLLPGVFAVSTIQTKLTTSCVSNGNQTTTKIVIENGNEFIIPYGTTCFESTQYLLRDAQTICGNVSQACDNDINLLVDAFRNQTGSCQSSIADYKTFIDNTTGISSSLQAQLDSCNQRINDFLGTQNNNDNTILLTQCNTDKKDCESNLFTWGIIGFILGAVAMFLFKKSGFAQSGTDNLMNR